MKDQDELQVVNAPIEAVVAWLENRPNRGAKMIGIISRTEPKMNVKSRIPNIDSIQAPNPF